MSVGKKGDFLEGLSKCGNFEVSLFPHYTSFEPPLKPFQMKFNALILPASRGKRRELVGMLSQREKKNFVLYWSQISYVGLFFFTGDTAGF